MCFNKFLPIVNTMPRCEQCQRDFETEEGLNQHMRDKHGIGKMSKHDMKEMKKQEREKEKETESKKQKTGKRMKMVGIAAVVILILAVISFAIISMPKSASPSNYDLSGFPNSFIHWHADVDVVICGEDKRLPEAVGGGLLGTNRLHTHDNSANLQSLPGSDGNGIIHTEGVVPQAPQEHTIEKFMRNIGVRFSNDTIMDKRNGDTCPDGTAGMVKVFVNEISIENFINYLPRDRDVIRIEFS